MKKIKKNPFAVGLVLSVILGVAFSFVPQEVDARALNDSICFSESKVRIGHTYYDCGSCTKVYDEKGRGAYSKCFK